MHSSRVKARQAVFRSRQPAGCPVAHVLLVREEDHLSRFADLKERLEHLLLARAIAGGDNIVEDQRTTPLPVS